MGATNHTANYDLPQWIGTDKPTFLGDLNDAFLKIDTAMKTNQSEISGAVSDAGNALAKATSAEQGVNTLTPLVNTASENASQALSTANNAASTANTANNNANSAKVVTDAISVNGGWTGFKTATLSSYFSVADASALGHNINNALMFNYNSTLKLIIVKGLLSNKTQSTDFWAPLCTLPSNIPATTKEVGLTYFCLLRDGQSKWSSRYAYINGKNMYINYAIDTGCTLYIQQTFYCGDWFS